MKYASVWQRLIAGVIDRLVGFTLAVWFVLKLAQSTSVDAILTSLLTYIIFVVWFGIGYLIIQAYLATKFGGSLGKLITGIEITTSSGKYISFWRAMFRELVAQMLSNLLFGLGFWWLLKDQNK